MGHEMIQLGKVQKVQLVLIWPLVSSSDPPVQPEGVHHALALHLHLSPVFLGWLVLIRIDADSIYDADIIY